MIKLGRVAPGAQPVDPLDKGVNVTLRGTVHFFDEPPVECYIKFLTARQLVNELFCSVLAQELELKVPRAFLVGVDRVDYPDAPMFVGNEDGMRAAFAVESLAHPSLKCRMRLESDDILSMLKAHWPEWTSAAAFDELIANADRNAGNLLIGAPDDVWLIDHTHALTGESWTSAGLVQTGPAKIVNQLARVLGSRLLPEEVPAEKQHALALQAKASALNYTHTATASMIEPFMAANDCLALVDFVNIRTSYIAKNVCADYGPTLF